MNADLPAGLILTAACILYTLAAARITRLITTDTITELPRSWIIERADTRPITRPIAALIDCGWCTSVWVSAAITTTDALTRGPLADLAAAWDAPRPLAWTVITAALAHAAGMLATRD